MILRKGCLKGIRQLPATFAPQNGSAIGNLHGNRETREMIEQRDASMSSLFGLESDQNFSTGHDGQHRVRPDRPEVVRRLMSLK